MKRRLRLCPLPRSPPPKAPGNQRKPYRRKLTAPSPGTGQPYPPSPSRHLAKKAIKARAGNAEENQPEPAPQIAAPPFSLADIAPYSGEPWAVVNGNVPYFSEEELTTQSFESYSGLDDLGRCGAAYACVGLDLMPTEERGSIGNVRPTI